MNRSLRSLSVLVFIGGLALAVGGCTYYQAAPGVYATTPANYDRAWSVALWVPWRTRG